MPLSIVGLSVYLYHRFFIVTTESFEFLLFWIDEKSVFLNFFDLSNAEKFCLPSFIVRGVFVSMFFFCNATLRRVIGGTPISGSVSPT